MCGSSGNAAAWLAGIAAIFIFADTPAQAQDAVERVCLYDEGRWYGLVVPDYNQCANRARRGARPQMIGAVYRARLAAYGGY